MAQIFFEFDSLLTNEVHVHLSDGTVVYHSVTSKSLAQIVDAIQRASFHAGPAHIDAVVMPVAFERFQPFDDIVPVLSRLLGYFNY